MHDPQPILLATAVGVALLHTLVGPDHYLPFIVLARAEGWPLRKTLLWTGICGVAHVLSSILLGGVAALLGWALSSVQRFEAIRGNLAALALITFGLVYFLWGLWRGRRGHAHAHVHADGSLHHHPHHHEATRPEPDHARAPHEEGAHVARHRRTVWTLFIIFALGPCEPLIPLVLAPAARRDLAGTFAVALSFSVVTIATMMVVVAVATFGVKLIRFEWLERYAHALAGFAIFASGLAIRLLGL
jgi:nickel/cobalt transporter (NicO) family protein